MDIPSNRYRCPLGRLQPQHTDLEALKERGWREQGLLVVAQDDERLDWMERQLLKNIGERLYGTPRQGGRHG
ncbi:MULTISPECIES: hypothetical protein [Pseudomonadota]|jgi:hypothetical protein|uniref:Uncharacterized protein n=2 Tax=Pseudomonadota TaxID=1224 RepID=A0A0K8QPT2_9GAMM|nr:MULTISPECIES: hypothetical protein [Pseudomonadota]TCP09530.1 hypothetical protein EV676_101103 [Caldimonas thermodepolymerans]UZG49551.1 hypothetical protein ONS87_08005 [Caldimonas thermodepolymerans]GAP66910.1 hypothetical protein MBSD_n2225 [Mizugakiibacter sediminis]